MKFNYLKYSLVLFPTISLGSCSGSNNEINNDKKEEEPVEEVPDWKKDDALKILIMGNSFSDDSMEYVANIAKDIGIKNIKLGNLFIGGCSLSKHYNNAIKDLKAYEYRRNSGVLLSNKKGDSISEAIEGENRDYISVQQNRGDSGIADSYSLYLENLIDFVINTANEDAKLVLK